MTIEPHVCPVCKKSDKTQCADGKTNDDEQRDDWYCDRCDVEWEVHSKIRYDHYLKTEAREI